MSLFLLWQRLRSRTPKPMLLLAREVIVQGARTSCISLGVAIMTAYLSPHIPRSILSASFLRGTGRLAILGMLSLVHVHMMGFKFLDGPWPQGYIPALLGTCVGWWYRTLVSFPHYDIIPHVVDVGFCKLSLSPPKGDAATRNI